MADSDIVRVEDTFQILLATDCHLGYMERDAVRGSDAITTFEEILDIAVENCVDFILLGGDLFHENKPSKKSLHQCMQLLRNFCMGDGAVHFDVLSKQSENFKHSGVKCVNYQDPNINIKLPIFSIHGNHDDPAGAGSFCTLDILSVSGLVNYFGKCTDLEKVNVTPLLLQKGCTKLALYGLGSIRDERLHRLFREGKVNLLRPKEDMDEWFNMFVLHQNRMKHGATNYIPEHFLHDFLDLIVWGHEHECRLVEEWNSDQSFYVTQPGSSVATSLSYGESVPKHVGLLQINKKVFKITPIPLRTVRQFYITDIDLENISINLNDHDATAQVIDYCKEKVEEYIQKASIQRSGHRNQPDKPLIRLRVQYPENFDTFNVQCFGQGFVDRVANPKDIILFSRKKVEKNKVSAIDADALKNVLKQEGFDNSRVEDLVKEYFQLADEKKQLSLLSEYGISSAVQEYVDKEVSEAINVLVDHQLSKVQNHLRSIQVSEDTLDDGIVSFRRDRLKDSSHELTELHEALKQQKNNNTTTTTTSQRQPNISNFSDDDDTMEVAVPVSRGRGRGRGSRGGGRGRGANKSTAAVVEVKSNSRSSRSSSRSTTNTSRASVKKENTSTTWKASAKQSTLTSFLNGDSDVEMIEDSDSDVAVAPKKQKTSKRSNTTSSKRKGVMYNSDSDQSF